MPPPQITSEIESIWDRSGTAKRIIIQ